MGLGDFTPPPPRPLCAHLPDGHAPVQCAHRVGLLGLGPAIVLRLRLVEVGLVHLRQVHKVLEVLEAVTTLGPVEVELCARDRHEPRRRGSTVRWRRTAGRVSSTRSVCAYAHLVCNLGLAVAGAVVAKLEKVRVPHPVLWPAPWPQANGSTRPVSKCATTHAAVPSACSARTSGSEIFSIEKKDGIDWKPYSEENLGVVIKTRCGATARSHAVLVSASTMPYAGCRDDHRVRRCALEGGKWRAHP